MISEPGEECANGDEALFVKLQQLRTDGQVYAETVNPDNWMWIKTVDGMRGRNFDLSEFNAALLLDGLSRLEKENDLRLANLHHLESCLAEIEGVEIVSCLHQVTKRVIWRLIFRLNPQAFNGNDMATPPLTN